MIHINATTAKNNFGELIDKALEAPVSIDRNGRSVAVILSHKTYEDFFNKIEALEDHLWALKAEKAREGGYLGTEKSEAYLKKFLEEEELIKNKGHAGA